MGINQFILQFVRSSLHRLKLLSLVLCTALLIVACANLFADDRPASEMTTNPSAVRTIQHERGTTDVPIAPQRVVTLDDCTLEATLALNVKPIGAPIQNQATHLQNKLTDIADIGYPPSLERILTLKPDLILGCAYFGEGYNQVSQIAPTVIISTETSGDWKSVFVDVAEALGKMPIAEQVMANYYDRLDSLKAQIKQAGIPANLQISVIRLYPEYIALYAQDVFIGTILKDAGLRRPPLQAQNIAVVNVSKERLQDADGNVIFLWTYSTSEAVAQDTQKALNALKTDPLWRQLRAVQQGNVYEVPDYWIGAGPLSANAVIDDLYRYLVDRPVPLSRLLSSTHSTKGINIPFPRWVAIALGGYAFRVLREVDVIVPDHDAAI